MVVNRPRSLSLHSPSSIPPAYYTYPSNRSNRLLEWIEDCVSFVISTILLCGVMAYASVHVLLKRGPKEAVQNHVWDEGEKDEELRRDMQYYASRAGFDLVDLHATTPDGAILKVHHVLPFKPDISAKHRPYPVLILHGLMQSSAAFITSEQRSLAFHLSALGFAVYLGNSRAVWSMSVPDWHFTPLTQARLDFPTLVEFVLNHSGHDKLAFVGHSQGTSLAFLALSSEYTPKLGNKMSVFVALAPAVYAGGLTSGPIFKRVRLKWSVWKWFFGATKFIPIMNYAYWITPKRCYAAFGGLIFSFLFDWSNVNSLPRRRAKQMIFNPSPVSSASICWWAGQGGFSDTGCLLDEDTPEWFDAATFPPISIFWGGKDFLVLTYPLLARLEEEGIDVIRTKRVANAEHCDFFWASDAVEMCFEELVDDIIKTTPKDIINSMRSSNTKLDNLVRAKASIDHLL